MAAHPSRAPAVVVVALACVAAGCADLDPLQVTACETSADCIGGRSCVNGACGFPDADAGSPIDVGTSDEDGAADAGVDTGTVPEDLGVDDDAGFENRPPVIDAFAVAVDGLVATVTVEFSDPDAGTGVTQLRVNWDESGVEVEAFDIPAGTTSAMVSHTYRGFDAYAIRATVFDGQVQSEEALEVANVVFPTAGLISEYLLTDRSYADTSGRGNDARELAVACVLSVPDRNNIAGRALGLNTNASGADGCGLDDTGRFGFDDPGLDGSFTISVWIDPEMNSDDAVILAQVGRSPFTDAWARLITGLDPFLDTDSRVSFIVPDAQGQSGRTLLRVETDAVPLDRWFNVTVTVASANGAATSRLYIDGVERDLATIAAEVANPAPGSAWLAGNFEDDTRGNRLYQGLIDDVRLYGRALSANEVRALLLR